MTPGFKTVFVAPDALELDSTFDGLNDIDVIKFDDHFFASISGYNELMLSKEFYESFSDYEYMLIHQSDAYLFKPELAFWCDKGYDYVGAPWIKPNKKIKTAFYKFLIKFFSPIYPKKILRRHQLYNTVGNGGLSLRRIPSFITIVRSQYIPFYAAKVPKNKSSLTYC